tara:strand:- start:34 stop:405 length:372 start_codon:yes stop_codon:yes gene_type:complete
MRITKDNINKFINKDSSVFKNFQKLDCSNMSITHIEFIPEGVEVLFCNRNKLTSLPKLPESLTHLYCSHNKLTSLPLLPDGLKYLNCDNNNLPYDLPYKVTLDSIKKHNKLIKRKEILKKICV